MNDDHPATDIAKRRRIAAVTGSADVASFQKTMQLRNDIAAIAAGSLSPVGNRENCYANDILCSLVNDGVLSS